MFLNHKIVQIKLSGPCCQFLYSFVYNFLIVGYNLIVCTVFYKVLLTNCLGSLHSDVNGSHLLSGFALCTKGKTS